MALEELIERHLDLRKKMLNTLAKLHFALQSPVKEIIGEFNDSEKNNITIVGSIIKVSPWEIDIDITHLIVRRTEQHINHDTFWKFGENDKNLIWKNSNGLERLLREKIKVDEGPSLVYLKLFGYRPA